jgi:hypothetical protein
MERVEITELSINSGNILIDKELLFDCEIYEKRFCVKRIISGKNIMKTMIVSCLLKSLNLVP